MNRGIDLKKEKIILLAFDDSHCASAPPEEEYFVILTRYTVNEIKEKIKNNPKMLEYAKADNTTELLILLQQNRVLKIIDCETYDINLYFTYVYGEH